MKGFGAGGIAGMSGATKMAQGRLSGGKVENRGKKRERESERTQGSKEKGRKGKEIGQTYIKEERGTAEDKRQRKKKEKRKREEGYIRGGGAGGRAGMIGGF